MKQKLQSGGMIAGMILFWSIFYAVSKYMVAEAGSPYLAGGLLRAAALLFLTIQLVVMRQFTDLFKQGKSVWILLLIGVFGFCADLFANLGYAHGSLGTGTALLKTDVLMANLVTVLLYHKRLTLLDWIGTCVMLLGVLLVLNVSFSEMRFAWTDLFFLLSAASLAANAFIIRYAQQRYGKTPEMISYYNNLVVLVLFAVSSAISGDIVRVGSVTAAHPWMILLGGLAQTGIYFFYYRNLREHEVWKVKLYLLLMPIVSAVIGVLFFGEAMTPKTILGIVVVLLGAGLLLSKGKLQRKRM